MHTILVTSGGVRLDESTVQANVDANIQRTGESAPAHTRQVSPEEQRSEAQLFGAALGGAAYQYDLCSAAGYLPKTTRSAEETANAILAKMAKVGDQARSMPDARKAWNASRDAVDRDRANLITNERCSATGKQWAKWMEMTSAQSR